MKKYNIYRMNNYDFYFADSYLGFWDIPNIGDKIPGTLCIEKHSIRLELFWDNHVNVQIRKIKSAKGYAFVKDKTNRKCYYFILNELYCTYVSWFGFNHSQYVFDIASFIIADTSNIVFDGIRSICIRTRLMDQWVWNYTADSFEYDIPVGNKTIKMEYTPKPSRILYESDDVRIYLKFGQSMTFPTSKGFKMTTHTFLNIDLYSLPSFDKAYEMAEQFIRFFSILWNNQFIPDFIEFRTENKDFIFKESDKYSYKYQDLETTMLATSISDFSETELSLMIQKWIRMTIEEGNSINTFFETQFNGHMSPSSVIKSYVSVIDGLSKEIEVVSDGCTKEGKKKLWFERLSEKIKGDLTKKELNELKMAVLRESHKELKARFSAFYKNLQKYISIKLEPDFCSKVIDTRNLKTHTKGVINKVYPKDNYWEVSICLEELIQAYLLQAIGMPSTVANKIVGVIKFDIE